MERSLNDFRAELFYKFEGLCTKFVLWAFECFWAFIEKKENLFNTWSELRVRRVMSRKYLTFTFATHNLHDIIH